MSPRVIEVAGAEPYPVVVCDDAAAALVEHLDRRFPRHACCVICDDVVARLHASAFADALRGAGRTVVALEFAQGEASKTRKTWTALTDAMLERRLGRDTVVVAVGGGVTGDLAGFVAATFMRGVSVAQVPTSLVAMVDAAIGGKTGVDAPAGKNLVGAFHPPSGVFVEPALLRTLPVEHRREGLVEALKHGAIVDRDYFDWILARVDGLLGGGADPPSLDLPAARALVERSIEIKAAVVSQDPEERGRRAILNFGHTVGHALERASGYTIGHGQAVAHGMIVEARIGERLGVTEAGTAEAIESAIHRLAVSPLPRIDPDAVLDAATLDKKNRERAIHCTLLRRIGGVQRDGDGSWTHALPAHDLVTVLRASLASE